jgi:hypothetical protein
MATFAFFTCSGGFTGSCFAFAKVHYGGLLILRLLQVHYGGLYLLGDHLSPSS